MEEEAVKTLTTFESIEGALKKVCESPDLVGWEMVQGTKNLVLRKHRLPCEIGSFCPHCKHKSLFGVKTNKHGKEIVPGWIKLTKDAVFLLLNIDIPVAYQRLFSRKLRFIKWCCQRQKYKNLIINQPEEVVLFIRNALWPIFAAIGFNQIK